MSRMCIDLQIALNEEKERNEMLSKRKGATVQRQLASEGRPFDLRNVLRKKQHDLQAFISKQNDNTNSGRKSKCCR